MSMLVKVHKRGDRTIAAVCDKNLLGKLFEEDGKQLDITGEFYNGEEREASEIGDIVRNADVVNLVGEESIKLGLQEELIDENQIIRIQEVPHAQAILMHD